MAANSTTTTTDPDEWEVVHDGGFVYKRKKRRLDPTAFVAAADPTPDAAIEAKERRKRKRQALLQLKDKYSNEIVLWERLSNSLKSIKDRIPDPVEETEFDTEYRLEVQTPSCSLLSEVLLQVEAQEAIIRDFSQLCEVAESLCSAHEEKIKNQFIDLPIWKSPQELMASLCED
ncbi:hypothetical protein RND81_07G027400 [Saponaria officinalis]|uniref:Uncharacterized protein n=1 Tax=Saponaria officinalis TaxID=3572 RepID=A0AAW1JN34_SAPOF